MLSPSIDKPVKSAIAVAALRAASSREKNRTIANPDHLAKYFVRGAYSLILAMPKKISRAIIERISPGSYCYFLARTQFIDHHFRNAIESNFKQIVILGAGYDTRASRLLDRHSDVLVYEIDLPNTQQDKIEKMKQNNFPDIVNVRYIPQDFNNCSLKEVLKNHNFDFSQPALFIFEGISYYLEENSNSEIFKLISSECAKNSRIVFDYSLKSFVEGDTTTYGSKKMQAWLRKNNEPFKFGLQKSEIKSYLNDLGLSLFEDIGSQELSTRYLTPKNGNSIGKPLGHLRLAVATNV